MLDLDPHRIEAARLTDAPVWKPVIKPYRFIKYKNNNLIEEGVLKESISSFFTNVKETLPADEKILIYEENRKVATIESQNTTYSEIWFKAHRLYKKTIATIDFEKVKGLPGSGRGIPIDWPCSETIIREYQEIGSRGLAEKYNTTTRNALKAFRRAEARIAADKERYWEVSDQDWERVWRLIPSRSYLSHPRGGDRETLNGILWKLEFQKPWSKMPKRYGNYRSIKEKFEVHPRRHKWREVLDLLGKLPK